MLVIRSALLLILPVLALAPPSAAQPCRDLSGLSWLSDDTFLAVHDAKVPEEADWPRISILHLPQTPQGPSCTPLDVAWPSPQRPSHDLESIARIPGTSSFLLAESGDDGSGYHHLFLADHQDGVLTIRRQIDWPVPVENVEGSAVARVGAQLIFLFAERAHGQPTTRLTWLPLSLDPLTFGEPEYRTFRSPAPTGADARPISAIEVTPDGRLLAASASDPDVDDGPFSSVLWDIGTITTDSLSRAAVDLSSPPRRLATLDGLKIESIALRMHLSGDYDLFVGTDDENYGSAIRPLPYDRPSGDADTTRAPR